MKNLHLDVRITANRFLILDNAMLTAVSGKELTQTIHILYQLISDILFNCNISIDLHTIQGHGIITVANVLLYASSDFALFR